MDNLEVYRKAMALTEEVYVLLGSNTTLQKEYALNSQLKRASLSVLLNITEGYGSSKKQFQRYLKISAGSANETRVLLQLIQSLFKVDTSNISSEYYVLSMKITRLRKSIK